MQDVQQTFIPIGVRPSVPAGCNLTRPETRVLRAIQTNHQRDWRRETPMNMRGTFVALITLASVQAAYAQGIGDFGPGIASTIIVDAPPREKMDEQSASKEKDEKDDYEEVVTTGMRKIPTKWAITPAMSHSDDRESFGVEVAAKRDRERSRFRLLSLAYSNIDPEGTAGPFDQARLRFRDKFFSSSKGWGIEGMAQIVRRWDSFIEPVVQLNVGFKLSDWTSLGGNFGYVWRNRDSGTTLKDFDSKFAVRQTLIPKVGFRATVDYRMKNDVTGEDDFSVGFELLDRWYLTVGKHWVTSMSYVHSLEPGR